MFNKLKERIRKVVYKEAKREVEQVLVEELWNIQRPCSGRRLRSSMKWPGPRHLPIEGV